MTPQIRLCRRCHATECAPRKQRCEACALACHVPGCNKPRRPGDRRCRAHTATAKRKSRIRHPETGRSFTDEQQVLRRARAYVAVYLRRGKLAPADRCEADRCRDGRVHAWWDDPRMPRAVRWLCAEHRQRELETRKSHAENVKYVSAAHRAALAYLQNLPKNEREQLEAQARGGPDGTGNWPAGSMFWFFALRRAISEHEERTSGRRFLL